MPSSRAIAAPASRGSGEASLTGHGAALSIGLSAVIVAASAQEPRVLTIRLPHRAAGDGSAEALPSGPLEAEHRTLEIGLRTWVERQTSQRLGDVERQASAGDRLGTGVAMALDHRRILATALGRLRGKIKYRPVVFELMPPSFTLLQLQRTVEALSGVRLHKQNFRRLVEQQGLVEETGEISAATGGRPARLVRFRREVLLERPAPGLRLRAGRRIAG